MRTTFFLVDVIWNADVLYRRRITHLSLTQGHAANTTKSLRTQLDENQ